MTSPTPAAVGGRVLDVPALVDLADRRSFYGAALLDVAQRTGVVLALPATGIAAAGAQLGDTGRGRLHVLAELWVTVIDPLTGPAAEDVGELLATTDGVTGAAADLAAGQAVRLALGRGWSVITSRGDRADLLRRIDDHVQVELLP